MTRFVALGVSAIYSVTLFVLFSLMTVFSLLGVSMLERQAECSVGGLATRFFSLAGLIVATGTTGA